MTIKLISSNDTDKKRVLHSKSDKIEIMIYGKVDEVIEKNLIHFCRSIKLCLIHQWKVEVLSLITFDPLQRL